jgi:Tfp pilus assembly protein PilV
MHSPTTVRPRRGFALALALIAIVVIGAMVAGGFMAGVQYYRIGRNSLVEQRALTATELGLDSAYAMWSKTWNTQTAGTMTTLAYSATDGSWVDTVRITKLNQLSSLIVSEGRAGGQGTQLSARRRAAMIVRLNIPKINQVGALTTRGNVVIGGGSNIYGTDTSLAGWNCPPAGASVAGVAVPSFSNLTFGGKCPGGSCISGNPIVSVTPTASDTNTYFNYGSLKWSDLVAMADKTVSGTLTHVDPTTNSAGGSPQCATSDLTNWGDPNRASPAGVCETYFPVVYAPGDLGINGDVGQGVLIVNGNLSIQGTFTFYGQIIVRGTVKLTGTGNHIYGGLMAAAVLDSTSTKIAGNTSIHYSRCAITSVFTSSAMGIRAPQRSWIELF